MAKKSDKEKKAPRVSVKVVSASEAKSAEKAKKTANKAKKASVKAEVTSVKTKNAQSSKRNPLRYARKTGLVFKPFTMFIRYVAASWRELRQVHWPNRGLTWQYTVAVLVFSLFFGGLIFGFDALFTYLFKEIII